MRKTLVKNAKYIHIIRVRSITCLEPFICISGIIMKNLHTLEFPWTKVPLIVSRGLALPGQREGFWSLFKLEGSSEDVEKESERRMVEEDRMAKDAERMAKQIASENNIDAIASNSMMVSGSVTQDWIRYRAMYPMRREQIMQDLVSKRAYMAYEQDLRRYAQNRQQQHQQETAAQSRTTVHEREEKVMNTEQQRRLSRIKLQEVVGEIVAFNKEHPRLPAHNHHQQVLSVVQLLQRDLQEKFTMRHLQLEADERATSAILKEGSHAEPDQLSQTHHELVLSLGIEAAVVHQLHGPRISVILVDFFRRYPTVRTFRDYGNHIESECLLGQYRIDGFLSSHERSMRHLSWSTTHGAITSYEYRRQLEGFLQAPYLNLESLRLSLLYPSGMDLTVSRHAIPLRRNHPSYLLLDEEKTVVATIDDRIKLMRRAKPIKFLTQLFIEDPMCPGTLVWSKNYIIPPWVPFLQRCPNLRSLALGSCPPPIWFEIARILQAHCPHIEDLAIAYGRQLNIRYLDKCDAALSALFFACSHPHMDDSFGQDDETIAEEPIEPTMGLKRLRLDAFVLPLKSHALRMLLDYHSGSLTDLGIMDCKNLQESFNRSTLLKILRSFEHLEQVHLLPSGEVEYVEEDHVFDAQVLIDSIRTPTQYTTAESTWACATSLKVLRIMIGGLASNNSAMDTTADGDFDLQRQIYRFLGSLKNLEELCLGFGPEEDSIFTLPQDQGRQKECLDFSLDTGLELLEGLKFLRVLNVARMNHQIRLSEVQWMCRTWPQLQMIEGLLKVKSLERWQAAVEADGDGIGDVAVAVGWGESLYEDRRLEEDLIVCWLQTHRPQLRFT
ncbi:hypothetical protein EC957_002572 [Mortierella hygrophila]|uniref:Uncharacterized protein n=1 Tax=Mortierella hygrophila TaxID=979708 RepID=A0A9P6F3D2_9FUNG|nr:hypothetical protein EC957_002572 [Mortierella hygrophila]